MIIEMNTGATKEQVDHVVERAHSMGFEVQLNVGTEKTVVAILGSDTGKTDTYKVCTAFGGIPLEVSMQFTLLNGTEEFIFRLGKVIHTYHLISITLKKVNGILENL